MAKEGEVKGLVRDLADKVSRGEISPEEAKRGVLKRGLHHAPYEYKYRRSCPLVTVGGLLCSLPLIAKLTGSGALSFLAQMPSMSFPPVVKIAMSALFVISITMGTYATYPRAKRGEHAPGTSP